MMGCPSITCTREARPQHWAYQVVQFSIHDSHQDFENTNDIRLQGLHFSEISGWDGYFTEELCCHGSADLHGLGSSSCWELMGLDARSGFTNCCTPGAARRSQRCWGTNPMLTEARCCGDDLVDENPANLPHDAVRRFDTATSALKLVFGSNRCLCCVAALICSYVVFSTDSCSSS